ncbi:hypothetical protein [Nocardioides conyzicola]|uniref:Uncharacterized protein n=1 Tax=Nocardioides conyzicola TaxID=1651781 RepID=A0ABP8X809_9ACTN
MSHRLPPPSRRLQTALLGVRAGALSLVVLAGLWAPAHDEGGGSFAVTADPSARVQRMIDRHDCSTTGFDHADPASALIRSADGRVRLVSFDRGWQVFTRHGAAQLVAVCLDDPPR